MRWRRVEWREKAAGWALKAGITRLYCGSMASGRFTQLLPMPSALVLTPAQAVNSQWRPEGLLRAAVLRCSGRRAHEAIPASICLSRLWPFNQSLHINAGQTYLSSSKRRRTPTLGYRQWVPVQCTAGCARGLVTIAEHMPTCEMLKGRQRDRYNLLVSLFAAAHRGAAGSPNRLPTTGLLSSRSCF